MSTRPGVKEVEGKLVATAGDMKPPVGWTTDFDEMGGEEEWGTGKSMEMLLKDAGVDTTNLEPLYAMEAWTGGSMILFESGSTKAFYFFSPIDYSVHKITLMDSLEKIVDWMNDEDKGYNSLETEQIV